MDGCSKSTIYANQREGTPNYHCMTMCVSADCSWRKGDVGVILLLRSCNSGSSFY
jgi:hypothetical protein